MTRVRLVRHGETDYTVDGRFLGATDVALNERGRSQAARLGKEIEAFAPEAVLVSPLKRTRATAELAAPGLAYSLEERLREVDFGWWEGLTLDEIRERDPGAVEDYERGRLERFPAGERPGEVAARFLDALSGEQVSRLFVVTHSTCLRIALAALFGLEAASYRLRFNQLDPASWTEIDLHDERAARLVSYNRVVMT
jgi:broad specificity phosphatase PhoE